jgi:diguanylate cyclase (GGDEF)-like protein
MSRSLVYGALGALLSIGAPLGWWALTRVVAERPGLLWGYMTFATLAVFTGFGAGLGVVADRLLRANAQLGHLATHDGLTSLRNARSFRFMLEQACEAARLQGKPLSLLVLDLDHFKRVNDSRGHAVGDQVLAAVGAALAQRSRAADLAFRIGGEEFAVVCEGTPAPVALEVAERLRLAIAAATLDQTGEKVSVSIGVAGLGTPPTADVLFRAADAALYQAKSRGRDQVVGA